jgi:hypothetical protein
MKYFTRLVTEFYLLGSGGYSIAAITFYLPRPHKLTNKNQSQIQSV